MTTRTEESTEYLVGNGRPVRVLWEVTVGATTQSTVRSAVLHVAALDGDVLSPEEIDRAKRFGFR